MQASQLGEYKTAVFWDVTPRRLVGKYQRFGATIPLPSSIVFLFIYQNTRRRISGDDKLTEGIY